MTYDQARRWLALYFLLVSAVLGAYMLIAAESPVLPISRGTAADGFKIVIPVLVGQVTIAFQWLSHVEGVDSRICPIPAWAIKTPPIVVAMIIIIAIAVMIAGNYYSTSGFGLSGESFNSVLTLTVSILNASTVFFVARLFPRPAAAEPAKP